MTVLLILAATEELDASHAVACRDPDVHSPEEEPLREGQVDPEREGAGIEIDCDTLPPAASVTSSPIPIPSQRSFHPGSLWSKAGSTPIFQPASSADGVSVSTACVAWNDHTHGHGSGASGPIVPQLGLHGPGDAMGGQVNL